MGDGFHPFTEPWMRAHEMKAFVDDIAYKRELRDRQRAQWQVEIEQTKRTNAMQDYMTRMALHQMGAQPAEAGASPQTDAKLSVAADIAPENARALMQTPVGQYRLPNQADREKVTRREATTAGTAAGYKQQAQEAVVDPYEELNLGPKYGNKTVKVPRSKAAEVLIKLHPNLQREQLGPNDQGDYTIIFRDPTTGEERYRATEKGAGKSQRATAAGAHPYIPNMAAERKQLADSWRPGVFAQFGITPEIEKRARGEAVIGYTEKDHLPVYDTEGQKEAVARIQHATAELDKAITRELENRARAPQASRATSAAATGRQSLAGYSIARANLAAAATAKGMTAQEFERQWKAAGGTIDP